MKKIETIVRSNGTLLRFFVTAAGRNFDDTERGLVSERKICDILLNVGFAIKSYTTEIVAN